MEAPIRSLSRWVFAGFSALLCGLLLTTAPRAETYEYDGAGRLTRLVRDDGSGIRYTYDARGNVLSVSNVPPGFADLELAQSAPTGVVGDLTFTLTVTNLGPDPAQNAVLDITPPPGTSVDSAAPSQGTCGGSGPVQCDLGDVANGAFATVELVATPAATGDHTNTGAISSDTTDPVPGNNSSMATGSVSDLDGDEDGVGDSVDNCRELANPGQEDFDAPGDDDSSLPGIQHYGDLCDADLNNDGLVNTTDFFGFFRPCFAASIASTPSCAAADLNGDGTINSTDFFGFFRRQFAGPPGPGFTEP